MKKIYLNPVAHVVELEEADIVTQSPSSSGSIFSLDEASADVEDSDKGRERNTIWDD